MLQQGVLHVDMWAQCVPHVGLMQMEVGIEECLHIEFEYGKNKYHMKDTVVGKIYFLLVRIKLKHMEIEIRRRETIGSGSHARNENETLAKYEIMDGAPVRGESIPIRSVTYKPTRVLSVLRHCCVAIQRIIMLCYLMLALLLLYIHACCSAAEIAAKECESNYLSAAIELYATMAKCQYVESRKLELYATMAKCQYVESTKYLEVQTDCFRCLYRLFLSPYDLAPTYKNVHNKFSVKYYLNLVLVDEEDRRYFKQQEITLYRTSDMSTSTAVSPQASTAALDQQPDAQDSD